MLQPTKKQEFEVVKAKRVLFGQYGDYEFMYDISPVSNDLRLAIICKEHNVEKYKYEGYYLLLHHVEAVYLRNVKTALLSSYICDHFEFIERFKVKSSLPEGEPEYYVALKIVQSTG